LVFRASLIIERKKLFFQTDGIGFLGQIVSNRNRTLTAYVFSEKTQTDDINRTVFSTFNKPIGIHPESGKPLLLCGESDPWVHQCGQISEPLRRVFHHWKMTVTAC
jgi:hypothetical protein